MTGRQTFLQDLKEGDLEKFQDYVHKNNAKDDSFNFKEIIQSLANKHHEELWEFILQICGKALACCDFTGDNEENPIQAQIKEVIEVLGGIAKFAHIAISVNEPTVPDHLYQLCCVLHGLLLSLPEEGGRVQNEISMLCESWYYQDLEGKEELITNTLPYLLAKTHTNSSPDNDYKRLWKIHEAFLLLDYDHESAQSLKNLILQCFFHPSYFTIPEGKQLLSFFFGIHKNFSMEVHKLMKNQLPKLPKNYLEVVGELYFKAWQHHSGVANVRLEEFIQDLMFHAIHAKRSGGTSSMSSRLRKVLSFLHSKKREPGVDAMLYKLYQPVLWRALKAANPLVRINAASLLVDAFPLQDPNSTNADNDEIIQKQFDTLAEMMVDPYPAVRATVIIGVCRIFSLFWEWIPANTIQDLLSKLVTDLAYDISSADVRSAVYQGLKTLVDCRLSHPLLKKLLPRMQSLIHDNSGKVRGAFLDLLLGLKGVRTLKFWHVVPVQHLLGRLEIETSSSCSKKIVKLLVGLFMPTNQGPAEQIHACLKLLQDNRAAARKFYQFVCALVPSIAVRKFISYATSYVVECCRRGLGQSHGEVNEDCASSSDDEGFEEDNPRIQDAHGVTEASADAITGVVEVIAILVTIGQKRFKRDSILKGKLLDKLCKALPVFLQSMENVEVKTAVMLIAKELPGERVPSISASCLASFQRLSSSVGAEEYGPLLDCLCQWNYCSDVLLHINALLKQFLDNRRIQGTVSKKKHRNADDVMPELALRYLSWLLTHCNATTMACRQEIKTVTQTLKRCLVLLSEALASAKERCVDDGPVTCLVNCFAQYCRLPIHAIVRDSWQMEPDTLENAVADHIGAILNWIDDNIISHLNNTRFLSISEAGPEYLRRGKKKKSDAEEVSTTDRSLIYCNILKNALNLLADVFLIGFGSPLLATLTANWVDSLLEYDFVIPLVPQISSLCLQISQDPRSKFNSPGRLEDDPTCRILKKIALSTSRAFQDDKFCDEIGIILLSSKAALTEIMRTVLMRSQEDGYQLFFMEVIVTSIVMDLARSAEKGDILDESNFKMTPLSTTFLSIVCKSNEIKRSFLSGLETTALKTGFELDAILAVLVILKDLSTKGLNLALKTKTSFCAGKVKASLEKIDMALGCQDTNFNRKRELGDRLCSDLLKIGDS